jgi:hypothetical protein
MKKFLPIVFMLFAYNISMAEDKHYDAKVQFINDSDQYIDFSLIIFNSVCINRDAKAHSVNGDYKIHKMYDTNLCSPRDKSNVVVFGKQVVGDITDKPYFAPGQKSEIKTLKHIDKDDNVMFALRTKDGEIRGLKGKFNSSHAHICRISSTDSESDDPTMYIYKDNKLYVEHP